MQLQYEILIRVQHGKHHTDFGCGVSLGNCVGSALHVLCLFNAKCFSKLFNSVCVTELKCASGMVDSK